MILPVPLHGLHPCSEGPGISETLFSSKLPLRRMPTKLHKGLISIHKLHRQDFVFLTTQNTAIQPNQKILQNFTNLLTYKDMVLFIKNESYKIIFDL